MVRLDSEVNAVPSAVPIKGRTTTTDVTSKFVRAAARLMVAAVKRVRTVQASRSAVCCMALAWVSAALTANEHCSAPHETI